MVIKERAPKVKEPMGSRGGGGEEKMKTKRGSNESGRKLIMYKKVMVKIVQWVHFAGGKLGSWLEK